MKQIPTLTKPFPVAALLCVLASNSYAEPNKVQYELQEQCGKLAAEDFRKVNGDGGVTNTKEGQAIVSYENHYSATLNKCFILEKVVSFNYKQQDKTSSLMMTLIDVNDHKEIGHYFKPKQDSDLFLCDVRDRFCHSESEWQELLKSYMEE